MAEVAVVTEVSYLLTAATSSETRGMVVVVVAVVVMEFLIRNSIGVLCQPTTAATEGWLRQMG